MARIKQINWLEKILKKVMIFDDTTHGLGISTKQHGEIPEILLIFSSIKFIPAFHDHKNASYGQKKKAHHT